MKILVGMWLILIVTLTGCGTSKISQIGSAAATEQSVSTIAVAPSGGVLADAIGIELANQGFRIIDANQTTNLLIRLNIDEIEISLPQNLDRIKQRGIDAYLSVRSVGGRGGTVESATATVLSTDTGNMLAGVSWQNAWGGQSGSIADRMMRKGLTDAAVEMASALAQRIR